jgi:RNA polymerase sigma factor (sigma-70 family)
MTLLLERPQLLLRFRAGDRSALEEVYRFYMGTVATFLARGFTFRSGEKMLSFAGFREPFDLDNALQETFTRAFRESARSGYDGLHPYRSYLLAIARNLVLDQLRRRDIPAGLLTEVEGGFAEKRDSFGEGFSGDTGERALLQQEVARLCARFVGELSERDRRFFEARFDQQRTQVEAGMAVGLSHMQSRTLEKKLRQRFLAFMHSKGYFEGYAPPGGKHGL